jgi:hypothetical protein
LRATIDTRGVRPLIGLLVVLGVLAAGPASASAVPPYDGVMAFPRIDGPAAPENYSWEVQLSEDEELVQIDDQLAEVVDSESGLHEMAISAMPAHDADGASVPTTIAVSEGNIVTLTVHHRAGNPAAGGASFVYPVGAGVGWEGGFHTYYVTLPPGDPLPAPPARCVVPKIIGRSLKAARRALRAGDCTLGIVWGKRSKSARIVRQKPKLGTSFAPGTEVGVKLGG